MKRSGLITGVSRSGFGIASMFKDDVMYSSVQVIIGDGGVIIPCL